MGPAEKAPCLRIASGRQRGRQDPDFRFVCRVREEQQNGLPPRLLQQMARWSLIVVRGLSPTSWAVASQRPRFTRRKCLRTPRPKPLGRARVVGRDSGAEESVRAASVVGLGVPGPGKVGTRRGGIAVDRAMARRPPHGARRCRWTGPVAASSGQGLDLRAQALADLGEVLRLADRPQESRAAFEEAIRLYEDKGNVVGSGRVRDLLPDRSIEA